MLEIVEWRPVYLIEGKRSIYDVSDTGLVRNHFTKRIHSMHLRKGYYIIRLYDSKKYHTLSVHRLVAKAFVYNPDPENKKYVNHKDGIKTNNNDYNLEWVTATENELHAYENKLKFPNYGTDCNFCKYDESTIHQICMLIESGLKSTEISRILDIPVSTIKNIKHHKSWKHISCLYNF